MSIRCTVPVPHPSPHTDSEGFYNSLDPGIRRTVRFFRILGYHTCDSGDGYSKPPESRTFDATPHVVIQVPSDNLISSTDRITEILRAMDLDPVLEDETGPVYPRVEGSYSEGHAVIIVFDLHDGNLPL